MVDAKSVSKTKMSAKEATHPKYSEMIATAIETLKEKGGSSRVAIIKFITSKYKVSDDSNVVNSRVKLSLKKGVASGALTQVKGTGASGSFKLSKKAAEKPKKVIPGVKSPKTAKSPKKPKAVKPQKAAKSSKKVAQSPKTAKSLKKAKRSPKKVAKSPKNAIKSLKKATKLSKLVQQKPKVAVEKLTKKAAKPKTKKPAVKKPAKK